MNISETVTDCGCVEGTELSYVVKWNVLYFKGRRGSTSELWDLVRRMAEFSGVS